MQASNVFMLQSVLRSALPVFAVGEIAGMSSYLNEVLETEGREHKDLRDVSGRPDAVPRSP